MIGRVVYLLFHRLAPVFDVCLEEEDEFVHAIISKIDEVQDGKQADTDDTEPAKIERSAGILLLDKAGNHAKEAVEQEHFSNKINLAVPCIKGPDLNQVNAVED